MPIYTSYFCKSNSVLYERDEENPLKILNVEVDIFMEYSEESILLASLYPLVEAAFASVKECHSVSVKLQQTEESVSGQSLF